MLKYTVRQNVKKAGYEDVPDFLSNLEVSGLPDCHILRSGK
jgi:hypothetical protein